MYKRLLFILLIAALSGCKPPVEEKDTPASPVLAFPGADGGGRYTVGGRGGQVIHITNLGDDISTPGCLRYALSRPGSKTIVFDIAGVIHLKRTLEITEGGLTIAGQSAPGDGICIADYPVVIKTSDVIIRFMRFRMGNRGNLGEEGGDALTVAAGGKNIIIDHCSCSWSTDECVSCYGMENFTMQYCIISESLRKSVHVKGEHGYGGIWGGKNATYHHNLLAHHDSRNPRFDHDYVSTVPGPIDYINNVVYNWGSNSAYGGEGTTKGGGGRMINFVANYYKPGPATKSSCRSRLFNPWKSCGNCTEKCGGSPVSPHVYLANNVMDGAPSVTANNWTGVSYSGGCAESDCRVNTRYSFSACMTDEQTAEAAYETVLDKAGCSLKRDLADARVVSEVRAGTYTYKGSNGSTGGLIDSQEDVGGWQNYKADNAQTDTDMDGIPDEWEKSHGLDYKSYKDGGQKTLSEVYTNLEVYLNEIVQNWY